MNLYHFYWDAGRQGHLEGWFLADPTAIQAAMGRRVYFGEVLGKHSEVYGKLEEKALKILSRDPEDIRAFQRVAELTGQSLGWNPLEYIRISCATCGADGTFANRENFVTCCEEEYCLVCHKKHLEKYPELHEN